MSLSEYFVNVVLISALAAFAELISYGGGEERGHKIAVSVILLYSLISPLVPLAESLGNFDMEELVGGAEELSGGAYLEVGEEAFREGILRSITEKWDLEKEKTVVSIIGFDFESMTCERVIVKLLSRGVLVDFHEIEAYIEAAGIGECEVKYAFEQR